MNNLDVKVVIVIFFLIELEGLQPLQIVKYKKNVLLSSSNEVTVILGAI
jgi:hypothetical protein